MATLWRKGEKSPSTHLQNKKKEVRDHLEAFGRAGRLANAKKTNI